MEKEIYSSLSRNSISLVAILFFSATTLFAQTIDGTTTFCPGARSTYNFTAGGNVNSNGTMTCIGCDQSSVQADGQSISLVWLPGQTKYFISLPVRYHPISLITIDFVMNYDVFTGKPLFICPSESSTSYVTVQQIPMNDSQCSNPPNVYVSLANDSDAPDFLVKGYPFDKSQGDLKPGTNERTGMHVERNPDNTIAFTAYWAPGWQGDITVTLQYERRTWSISGCDGRIENVVTFTWSRWGGSPGGTLSGPNTANLNTPINIVYQPDSNYPGTVQEIKYFLNGTEIADKPGCSTDQITYTPTNSGQLNFTTRLLDQCGVWHDGPPKVININPTCFQDNPANVNVTLTGSGLTPTSDGYLLTEGSSYQITVTGITDFASNYSIDYGAGQSDMSISGNTFSVNVGLGEYQIGFTKMDGRAVCPDIPGINVFLSNPGEILEQDCPIVLPADIGKFNLPNVTPASPVLKYFASIVKSKSSITITPGITLSLGAELVLIQDPPSVPPTDTDGSINFVQSTSYDEFNRIISQGRSYFDEQGRSVQSQSKNFSAGLVIANATIYDAYGRKAIATMPAPVSAAKISTKVCDNSTARGPTYFSFSADFLKKGDRNGSSYGASDFDINNGVVIENAPQVLTNSSPGTLGWYYGKDRTSEEDNNYVSMNEPLVATTNYPYTRTVWHRDGSGNPKGSTKPGDAFHAGGGHVTFADMTSVIDGDQYLTNYFSMGEEALGLSTPHTFNGNYFTTLVTDANGRKSIDYIDKEGKTIISLYFGQSETPLTTSYQFYDLAGRLLVSVSPNGVSSYNGSNFDQIDKTKYFYNSKGWVTAREETDAGRTEFLYRKDGKLRFSQNADQRKSDGTGRFNYTHYDRSGRPIESGEYIPSSFTFKCSAMNGALENISATGGLPVDEGSFNNRVFTYYDSPDENLPVQRTQRFVLGAISSTKNENITTWYSYDEQGRGEWIVQDIKGLGVKTIDYRYGQTGAVRQVTFQEGDDDERFSHYYEYDPDGRMYKAYITRSKLAYDINGKLTNPEVLELQATYFYYSHGPLKRIEYANKLQGIDYTYTADGALKGINHFDPSNDPGKDGSANDFRPDVFGTTLDYYDNDFNSNFSSQFPNANAPIGGVPDQFGGHIKGARWHGPVQPDKQWGYTYQYDERYQFTNAAWGQMIDGQFVTDANGAYQESITGYDSNGNINGLLRNGSLGSLGAPTADFAYNYTSNTNKLESVAQRKDHTDLFRRYTYNGVGQMVNQQDATGGQTTVTYDANGRVTSLVNQNGNRIVDNSYDEKGLRLSKTGYDKNNKPFKTWYVHDANGNVAAIYNSPPEGEQPELSEFPVYGLGKIGVHRQFARHTGMTFYEVADHLGTVRAVIGDKLTLEYLATMEDDRKLDETDFYNITPVPTATQYINHTPAEVTVNEVTIPIADPNKVIRINNGQDNPKKPVGGGIMLWVHPGDVVNAEVFAKYANFDGTNNAAITGITSYLTTMFFGDKAVIDGVNPFSGVDGTPTGVFSALGNIDDTRPRAFLTYILYDRNMVPQAFDLAQVTDAAAISTVSPEAQAHERLHLDNIAIQKEGFIYIYVSNLSDQNMDVYFDDLKVTHQLPDIVAGGDYYPFGLEITDRQITREEYRYKYQGKYAEKDEETGWNHFQLREYDPLIGRWTATDPKRAAFSPYNGMANNPISNVDPDGGDPNQGVNKKGDIVFDDGKNDGNIFLLNDDFKGKVEDLVTLQKNSVQLAKGGVWIGTMTQLKAFVVSQMKFANFAYIDKFIFEPGDGLGVSATYLRTLPDGTVIRDALPYDLWQMYIFYTPGEKSEKFSNVYNLRSSLEHENYHIISTTKLIHSGKPEVWSSETEMRRVSEQSAVWYQWGRKTWSKTTKPYRQEIQDYYDWGWK